MKFGLWLIISSSSSSTLPLQSCRRIESKNNRSHAHNWMTEFVKRLNGLSAQYLHQSTKTRNCRVDMQWFRSETKIYMSADWQARRHNNNNFDEASRCVVCACVSSIWIVNFWIAYILMYARTLIWRNGASERAKKVQCCRFHFGRRAIVLIHVRRTLVYVMHKELFFMIIAFNQPTQHFHRVSATIDYHRSISSFILFELSTS